MHAETNIHIMYIIVYQKLDSYDLCMCVCKNLNIHVYNNCLCIILHIRSFLGDLLTIYNATYSVRIGVSSTETCSSPRLELSPLAEDTVFSPPQVGRHVHSRVHPYSHENRGSKIGRIVSNQLF